MASIQMELRAAGRFFARKRTAAVLMVVTLGLAIGANTAVFSILKALLFAQLGFAQPERVMYLWSVRHQAGTGATNFLDAYPNVEMLRSSTRFWERLGTTTFADLNWQRGDGPTRRLQGAMAEAEFFGVFGVQPVLGRLFRTDEEGPGPAAVAVISHRLWQTEFSGRPDVLGAKLVLNNAAVEVIGVLPPSFSQPLGTEIWLPFDLPPGTRTAILGARQCGTYVRLKPGVTVAAANEELRQFAPSAIAARPENKEWSWAVQPLMEGLLGGADKALLLVQAGAGILLLLALSNLVALQLAWALERRKEMAVRVALGARGRDLLRQSVVQALLLVAAGGVCGVLGAQFALPALQMLNPTPALASLVEDLRLDGATLAACTVLVVVTGLAGGLVPAWLVQSGGVQDALAGETRGATGDRRSRAGQRSTIFLQTAISVVILIAACLAGAGFWRLNRTSAGFEADNRVAFQIQFPEPAYGTHERRAQFIRELEDNLAREPALRSFGFTTTLAVGDFLWGAAMFPQLRTGEFAAEPVMFQIRRVTPGYLPTLGVPLVAGRPLSDQDRAGRASVAVVSRNLAERYWPGESAIGKKLRRVAPANAPVLEIVGVVGEVRDAGLGTPAPETVYVPFDQISVRRGWVVLAGDNVAELLAAGQRALRRTSPEFAAYGAATLTELLWQANAMPRLQMYLLGTFAFIAAGIAALGSYGIMTQMTSTRDKEIAIRTALGASRGEALWALLGSTTWIAAAGAAGGMVAAWILSRWAQQGLTAVPTDVYWPFAAVTLGVILMTLVAGWIPARKALHGDVARKLAG